jgi:hypothetical protein
MSDKNKSKVFDPASFIDWVIFFAFLALVFLYWKMQ